MSSTPQKKIQQQKPQEKFICLTSQEFGAGKVFVQELVWLDQIPSELGNWETFFLPSFCVTCGLR